MPAARGRRRGRCRRRGRGRRRCRTPIRGPAHPARHAALFRIVIAEVPRFPELGETRFKLGKLPYFESVRRYLAAENAAGTARLDDAETAAAQFLGMISDFVFWPRMLLAHWEPDDAANTGAVDEALLTMLARYGTEGTHGA